MHKKQNRFFAIVAETCFVFLLHPYVYTKGNCRVTIKNVNKIRTFGEFLKKSVIELREEYNNGRRSKNFSSR